MTKTFIVLVYLSFCTLYIVIIFLYQTPIVLLSVLDNAPFGNVKERLFCLVTSTYNNMLKSHLYLVNGNK